MKKIFFFFFLSPVLLLSKNAKLRGLADTAGFAHLQWQMDSVSKRTNALFGKKMEMLWKKSKVSASGSWKVAISPHDDYTYASYMYPLVLRNVKAKTVILFGVAHKAKQMKL